MSYKTYLEQSIHRKAVQRGIAVEKPLSPKAVKSGLDWLVVSIQWKYDSWSYSSTPLQRERALAEGGRFKIAGEYKSEAIARGSLVKATHLLWRGRSFICSRDLYDRVYKDVVL